MISRFFTTAFTVKRMVWSGDSSREIAQTGFSGWLQQASMDMVRNTAMSFGRVFIIRCPITTDIQAGDTLDDGVNTYSVKSINIHQHGRNCHKQLLVDKDETA